MTLGEICSEVRKFIAAPDVNATAFDMLARRIFAFQFAQNAAYRAFCNAQGVSPATLDGGSADRIPAIVTSAFKDLDLSVVPAEHRTAIFHSSGTTAQRPSRHFHSVETLAVYEDSLLRWFEPHLVPEGQPFNFLVLSPLAKQTPHSSLVHMFETVAARFGESAEFVAGLAADGGWELEFDRVLRAHEKFAAAETPVIICGTAFSFVHLCDGLDARGMKMEFPRGSRIFETGGYKGRSRSVIKSVLHEMISDRLAIPPTHIVSEYGMSELSSQAYDRVAGHSRERAFRFPQWARATILSPETGKAVADGETGLVRVVDLANVGSVIAIQTEDLATRRGEGFELIGRASEAEARGCSLMQVDP